MPPFLDQETLYQLVYARQWMAALDALHRHAAALPGDARLAAAAETCMAALFADLAAIDTPDADVLEKLLLLHTGGFYQLSAARFETAVTTLVRLHQDDPEKALGYARFAPEHPTCAAVLRAYDRPPPARIAHPDEGALRLEATTPRAAEDATRSLFRSRQEAAFFLAVREVFAAYVVYPNVALHSVLDFDRLRGRLTAAERQYFFHTLIDCVVFDQHDDYRPHFFFELDSPLHDTEDRQEKDRMKDHILALAGQRLYRLRRQTADADRTTFIALLRAIAAGEMG